MCSGLGGKDGFLSIDCAGAGDHQSGEGRLIDVSVSSSTSRNCDEMTRVDVNFTCESQNFLRPNGNVRAVPSPEKNSIVHRPQHSRARLISIGIIAVGIAGGCVLLLSGFFAADAAEVVRVVDGDTVIVKSDGDEKRVRVLDIDTPETVDPSEPEECLGQEASRFTESVLSPGTPVELQFDHDAHDPYGRDLAVIRFDDGKSLAEELARRGLGVPFETGANDARLEPVREAFREAASSGRGFFDDSIDCTVASGLQQLSANEAKIADLDAGSSSSDAAAAAASTVAILSSLSSLETQLGIDSPMAVRAFVLAGKRSDIKNARTAIEDLHQRQERFEKTASNR